MHGKQRLEVNRNSMNENDLELVSNKLESLQKKEREYLLKIVYMTFQLKEDAEHYGIARMMVIFSLQEFKKN